MSQQSSKRPSNDHHYGREVSPTKRTQPAPRLSTCPPITLSHLPSPAFTSLAGASETSFPESSPSAAKPRNITQPSSTSLAGSSETSFPESGPSASEPRNLSSPASTSSVVASKNSSPESTPPAVEPRETSWKDSIGQGGKDQPVRGLTDEEFEQLSREEMIAYMRSRGWVVRTRLCPVPLEGDPDLEYEEASYRQMLGEDWSDDD